MAKRGNIGVTGVESIRIGDLQICDLPIAEAAIVKQQIPIAEDTERQNKIDNILAGYPQQSVKYLDSRMHECETNIGRVNQLKAEQTAMISDYTSQLTLCKFRDKEIEKIDDTDPDKDTKVKELFKQFPPYNVDAMKQQIIQSNETIQRGDEVIAVEYNSIAELRELKGLCEQRDMKLRQLGAKIVGS